MAGTIDHHVHEDPATSLHEWLKDHGGGAIESSHLGAALSLRARWSAPPKVGEAGATRVLAVCRAQVELAFAKDCAATDEQVRRMLLCERSLRTLLQEFSDVPRTAAARQGAYMAIGQMYQARANRAAAEAFAFGPPEIFARLETCLRELQRNAAIASATSGYELKRGRPEYPGLTAATQQLHAGGFAYAEIAKLLPDGVPSKLRQAEERVRNRVRAEDRRTILE